MRTVEEILKDIVTDVEEMQVENPFADYPDGDDEWYYGPFGTWTIPQNCERHDEAIVQWPNLGILIEEAKKALKK